MSIEGGLRIELRCRERRVGQVRILSSRPLQLPRLFTGKPVREVLQTIPMLYSICAIAQARAASIACRQALGVALEPRIELAESMLVWFETAREHLWRVLIDWPGYLGEEVDRSQLPGLSQLLAEAKQTLFDGSAPGFTLLPVVAEEAEAVQDLIERLSLILEQSVFGRPAADWHAMASTGELEKWMAAGAAGAARYLTRLKRGGMERLGQSTIQALPAIDENALHERLQLAGTEAFLSAPEWRQAPHETNSLTRQLEHPLVAAMQAVYGKGLLTRLVARLVELAAIPQQLGVLLQRLRGEPGVTPASGPVSGWGLGVVEAARGRLFHHAIVSGDLVESYQILAPTEWNFHPRGLVAEGLLGLPCDCEEGLRQQAALFIGAVDPCVSYSLEFI